MIACTSDDGTSRIDPDNGDEIASPTVTATPEPVSAADAQAVYAIVDALETHDEETIRPHLGLRNIPCSTSTSTGGPPRCVGGEADGDPIDAFYYSDCEGEYLRASELELPLTQLSRFEVEDAYRIGRKTDAGYEYAVVLVDSTPEREGKAWEAIINGGEVIGLLFSCSLSAEELVDARGYGDAVPTPEPVIATPAP